MNPQTSPVQYSTLLKEEIRRHAALLKRRWGTMDAVDQQMFYRSLVQLETSCRLLERRISKNPCRID